MPALIGLIVVLITVIVIIFTRYESPKDLLQSTEYLKTHLDISRKWVQIFIDSNDMSELNYRNLADDDIIPTDLITQVGTDDPVLDTDNDTSTYVPPGSGSIYTQIIPDPDRSGYWIFYIDISSDVELMRRGQFIQELFLTQYCAKDNYGTKLPDLTSYNQGTKRFNVGGTNSDGKFGCSIPE